MTGTMRPGMSRSVVQGSDFGPAWPRYGNLS